jgi:hypothetical protein
MPIRYNHKFKLKEILETIQYNGQPIVVLESYQSNPSSYPYYFIQSGEFKTEFLSNRRKKNKYTYYITLAFSVEDAINQVAVDILEEEFIKKLTQESTRDANSLLWQDLFLTSVSEMGQNDINIQDNIVMKVFTIEIETITIYN